MQKLVDIFWVYLKDRFTFYPWLLAPTIIFAIGHNFKVNLSFILIYNLLLGVLFFRILSDLLAWNYFKSSGKDWSFLKFSPKLFLPPLAAFSFLFLSSNLLIFNQEQNFFIAGSILFLIISFAFFKRTPWIQFAAVVKYPLFFFLLAQYSGEQMYIWPIMGSLYFSVREILEEIYNKKNYAIELCFLVGLIGTKVVMAL